MPGRLTHVVSSSFMGAAVAFVRTSDQPDSTRIYEIFGGFAGGYLGGRAPDILDSARTPNHRSRAHSFTVAAGLIKVSGEILENTEQTFRHWASALAEKEKTLPEDSLKRAFLGLVAALCRVLAGFVAGFIAGYLTHLALDGTTPRSLQLI